MKNDWKLLQKTQKVHLNAAIHEYHRLAQLIAIVGKNIAQHSEDDSHTAMQWSEKKWLMLGESLPIPGNPRFVLQIENMQINFEDSDGNILAHFDPVNLKKQEAISIMKNILADHGTEKLLHKELHFSIQEDFSNVYAKPSVHLILEHLHLRHNAYLALDQTGQKLDQDSSILIWPQHFDTRCTVNIERDENLTSELIFGFAIADNIYSCPYFYVKFNSNDLETRHSELNELKHSGKRNTVQWQGYLLGIDTIVERETADEQCEMVVEFLEKSIEEIRNLLTSNKQEII